MPELHCQPLLMIVLQISDFEAKYVTYNILKERYFLQALLGCLLFGEALSARWWLGTSLILTGLVLIHYNSAPLTDDHLHDKEE